MNAQLVSTDEAAEYLGLSPYVLQKDRCSSSPSIPVIYVRSRTPRYAIADLKRYVESNRLGPDLTDDLDVFDAEEGEDFDDELLDTELPEDH